jgi:hypothetical protein
MSVRETITRNPAVSTVIALVLLSGCLFYILHGSLNSPSASVVKAYFTIDEGKTVFTDTVDHIPPFDHSGEQAYKVWMFSCDGGTTKFPGFLERYTPQAKAKMESALADFNSGKSRVPPVPSPGDTEVKKPGPGNPWVSRTNYQEAQKITNVQCPDGSGGTPEVQVP